MEVKLDYNSTLPGAGLVLAALSCLALFDGLPLAFLLGLPFGIFVFFVGRALIVKTLTIKLATGREIVLRGTDMEKLSYIKKSIDAGAIKHEGMRGS